MKRILPKELTSYDLIKTLAVVLMIADHVGWYFFPEDNWWRVFGRLCVPIWFFLIGYANSRDLGRPLWLGAGLLMVSDLIAGITLFPVNILATMIVLRLTIDGLMHRALRDVSTFWAVNTVLFFLIIPSGMFFEYGTGGFILAIFGWLARRRAAPFIGEKFLTQYFAFAAGSFFVTQFIIFGFNQDQMLALVFGLFIVMGGLFVFRPAVLNVPGGVLTMPLVWLFQFIGRHTLLIYVGHLLLFKAAGMYFDPDRFTLLEFSLFYTGMNDDPPPLEAP